MTGHSPPIMHSAFVGAWHAMPGCQNERQGWRPGMACPCPYKTVTISIHVGWQHSPRPRMQGTYMDVDIASLIGIENLGEHEVLLPRSGQRLLVTGPMD